MNRDLSKAIMTRSRLRNIYIKDNTIENRSKYVRQRNFCVNLLRKVKRDYYNNINVGNITDNKRFWSTVKPCFTDKSKLSEQINLVENNQIITDSTKVANIMVNFFSNVVNLLDIQEHPDLINDTHGIKDPVDKAIIKYNRHPSIQKIRERDISTEFRITHTTVQTITKVISEIDTKKSTSKDSIPAKILKINTDLVSPILCNAFNTGVTTYSFSNHLKLAEIKPIFKKDDRTDKENYRPVSLLPIVSKVYEKVLNQQLNPYFDNLLSHIQCGFRKGHSPQYALLVLVEKWRKDLDNKKSAGILLTDLSKVFDCIRHDLLIAKCHAYGVDKQSLRYIYDYLSGRKQRVRINNECSQWKDVMFGVPQGSILGPLFFNIFICDLFLFTNELDIVSYADDNTPCAFEQNTDEVIKTLEKGTSTLFKWVSHNFLKANLDKCHAILSTHNDRTIKILNEEIENSPFKKLLGITIDRDLNFDNHVRGLCNKASLKLHALLRISNFMSSDKLKIVMKAFVLSQFNYCPLIWMFHSRELNNRINHIHERALRIAYKDKSSSFAELLRKDGSVTIHYRNLQALVTEIYKFLNGQTPKIMEEIFQIANCNYNLRTKPVIKDYNVRTVHYGQGSISFLAPRIWMQVPENLRNIPSLQSFKTSIKKWIPINCPCRLYKEFVPELGFI